MTNFTRWDPFADLRQTMDELFEQGFSRPWRFLRDGEYQAGFPIDIWETPDSVEVRAALPGFRPEQVDITVVNDALTIKAEQHEEPEAQQRRYYSREITLGSLNRTLSLPASVESDKSEARFENGMLQLRLPKAESVRPKQIKISAGGDGHLLN